MIAAACVLAVAAVGCGSKSDDAKDKKIAELEQQLQASKAAEAQKPAEATTPPPEAAPAPAPAPGQTPAAAAAKPAPAKTAPKPKPPAGVTAEQYEKDRAKVKGFADAQRDVNAQQAAANAQQAATNTKVQQQIEDLKPIEVTLPEGTVIPARPSSELTTDKLKDGATFEALLENDLVVNGTLVARKGAHVTGVVVTSDPGGRVKGVASLTVTARAIEGPKGTTIRLHTDNFSTQAATSKGKDAARTGIMAGAGAVIGAIAGGGKGAAIGAGAGAAGGVATNMATRGKAAVIPAETLIEFKLTQAVTVQIPR
jgi:hypothetical protein